MCLQKNETVCIIGEYFLRNLICAKYCKNSCYRYNYLFDIKRYEIYGKRLQNYLILVKVKPFSNKTEGVTF